MSCSFCGKTREDHKNPHTLHAAGVPAKTFYSLECRLAWGRQTSPEDVKNPHALGKQGDKRKTQRVAK